MENQKGEKIIKVFDNKNTFNIIYTIRRAGKRANKVYDLRIIMANGLWANRLMRTGVYGEGNLNP